MNFKYFINIFLKTSLITFTIVVFFSKVAYSNEGFCASADSSGKYYFILPTGTDKREFNSKSSCESDLKEFTCKNAMIEKKSCRPFDIWGSDFVSNNPEEYCNNFKLGVNVGGSGGNYDYATITIDTLKTRNYIEWVNYFRTKLGDDWDDPAIWNDRKDDLYGVYQCRQGTLVNPGTVPNDVVCNFPGYDTFAGSGGTSSCSGWEACKRGEVIREGLGVNQGKKFFCLEQGIYMCPNEVTSYDKALESNSGCSRFNNLTADNLDPDPSTLTLKPTDVPPLSPLGLIRNVSNFLYYFAIFYFIILILTNAFSYVRAGEDPQKLKQIKESLFNTVAGFLFVILSGGVIVYLINQISI